VGIQIGLVGHQHRQRISVGMLDRHQHILGSMAQVHQQPVGLVLEREGFLVVGAQDGPPGTVATPNNISLHDNIFHVIV
jgi:hypothetical protein